jgi:hypothetical protein
MPQAYTVKDFSRCFFNPLEENLFSTYPQLHDLLPEGEIDERTIRYCLALYDPKSPVVRDNPDMSGRKSAAAEVAGFSIKDTAVLDRLYACNDEAMVLFIMAFFKRVVQSRLWASIQADEQVFWEFIQRLFKPISEESDKNDVDAHEKKLKIAKGKEEVSALIEQNWIKMIGDDEELKKKVKRPTFSPESMAGVK